MMFIYIISTIRIRRKYHSGNKIKAKFSEIVEKEENISSELFEKYIDYSSPSAMIKPLNETKNSRK